MSKIKIIGDSLLKGIYYDESKDRHTILKNSGIERLKKDGYNITNDTKFGLTTPKALEILKRDINTFQQFDEVYIELGGNDCNYDWDQVSLDPYKNHQPVTPIDVYESALCEIIDFLRTYEIKPILVSLPPLDYKQFYCYIVKGRNEDNIMAFLKTKEEIYLHQKRYNDVVYKISRQKKVDYIPLREMFLDRVDFLNFICKDGMHLTENGQEVIYESFLKFM
ncbi:MAG TPA: hypothetical protein DEA45_02795 [Acholeplasmataceae bacterium]|nr:hypothetical protein [Acholeplasmataceae bacterium]